MSDSIYMQGCKIPEGFGPLRHKRVCVSVCMCVLEGFRSAFIGLLQDLFPGIPQSCNWGPHSQGIDAGTEESLERLNPLNPKFYVCLRLTSLKRSTPIPTFPKPESITPKTPKP